MRLGSRGASTAISAKGIANTGGADLMAAPGQGRIEEEGPGGLVETFLFDPGSLTGQAPEVVESGPPDPAQLHDFELLQPGRVEEEGPLDTHGMSDPTHREIRVDAPVVDLDNRPLEDLYPLPGAFNDAVVDLYRISGVYLVQVGVGLGLDDRTCIN